METASNLHFDFLNFVSMLFRGTFRRFPSIAASWYASMVALCSPFRTYSDTEPWIQDQCVKDDIGNSMPNLFNLDSCATR